MKKQGKVRPSEFNLRNCLHIKDFSHARPNPDYERRLNHKGWI